MRAYNKELQRKIDNFLERKLSQYPEVERRAEEVYR